MCHGNGSLSFALLSCFYNYTEGRGPFDWDGEWGVINYLLDISTYLLIYSVTINSKLSHYSLRLLSVLVCGGDRDQQVCVQRYWERLHPVLLLRHQDGHLHREEPEGEHGEQRADRVHAVRVAVRRVRVRGAGGPDQGDHRPVHPQPGRVQEDIRQHQPVHDQDAGRSSQL